MTLAFLDHLVDLLHRLDVDLSAPVRDLGRRCGAAGTSERDGDDRLRPPGAARGQLSLDWVIEIGAAGAFVGDNSSYALGRWVGEPVIDRFFRGERAQAQLEWARRFLRERGSYVLVVARFVPGGRTATTFTSGVVRLPWRMRFAPFIAVAAVLWAVYGALLGYLGGRIFRGPPIYALVVALGLAAFVAASGELVRRARSRG